MTTSADAFTFDSSTSLKNTQPVFTSKQWSYQIDQNNGAYQSKQIIFDLSGFYNSQRFINPSEMFVVFPTVLTMTALPATTAPGVAGTYDGLGAAPSSTMVTGTLYVPQAGDDQMNGAAVTNQFAMGFKSNFVNLINSVQIQVDGKDIIQLTPYLNYLANFETITTWSESDIKKYGQIEGINPDKSDSWRIVSANSSSNLGIGVCNNLLPGSSDLPAYPSADGTCSAVGGTSNATVTSIFGSWDLAKNSRNVSLTQQVTASVNDPFYERMKTTNSYQPQDYLTGFPKNFLNVLSVQNAQRNASTVSAQQYALDSYMASEKSIPVNTLFDTADHLIAGPDSSSATAFRQIFASCVVKFKTFCNLFEKLPLTRGLYMRITFNMNTGYIVQNTQGYLAGPQSTAFTPQSNSAAYPIYINATQNTFTGTCPFMLSPIVASAPGLTAGQNIATSGVYGVSRGVYPSYTNSTTLASCGVANQMVYPGLAIDSGSFARTGVIVSCSIVNPDPVHKQYAPNIAIQPHTLQNCRIYAPIIDMEPDLVTQYITNFKQQAVYYRDSLWFSQIGVPSQGQFNTQVGNGFVNLQRLVIMPFYHDAAANIQFEPTSPFSSAPSTVAPQSELVDFNVLISNMNMFQRNVSYSFENFLEEMGLANAINGGLDTGFTCGRIGFYDWQNLYRYYVVDLSRRLAGDNTPKSVTVIGRNNSNYAVDYYYFLQYRRHLTIDIESGHISVSSN